MLISLLTKNRILEKVKGLLQLIQEEQEDYLSNNAALPAIVRSISAKISKGENYNGLPYLVLDQPRLFIKEDMYAIRTMFWWGNFFSTTLLLSGKYKTQLQHRVIDSYDVLKQDGYYLCINADPWEHHFESGNFAKDLQLEQNGMGIHYQQTSISQTVQTDSFNTMGECAGERFTDLQAIP